MFGKGAWTLLKLVQGDGGVPPQEVFKSAFADAGSRYIPLVAISEAISKKTTTIGLSPFSQPRMGDVEEVEFYFDSAKKDYQSEDLESFINNQGDMRDWEMNKGELCHGNLRLPLGPFWSPGLNEWSFSPGVYGMWMMVFEYIDAMDKNSKKEALAYNYGAPFKFQNADIKKQITEQVDEVNTFTRKHHEVVLDFNMGYVWINSGAKSAVTELLFLLDQLGLQVETPVDLIGAVDADAISRSLEVLYASSIIKGEVVQRLEDFKLHGPDGIEPDSNAVLEKILKTFCAFSEIQSYHIGMAAPLSISLSPNFITTIGARTTYEVTELLHSHDETQITGANLTFCHYDDRVMKGGETKKILNKLFTIQAGGAFLFTDLPGLIVHGFSVDNFRHMIKTHIKATGSAPTIPEYWKMGYDSMKEAIFTYYSVLKDVIENVTV
jgi:hypothetical protein